MNRAIMNPPKPPDSFSREEAKLAVQSVRLEIEGRAFAELKRLLKRRRDLAERGFGAFTPQMVDCEKNICALVHAQHDIREAGLNDDMPF